MFHLSKWLKNLYTNSSVVLNGLAPVVLFPTTPHLALHSQLSLLKINSPAAHVVCGNALSKQRYCTGAHQPDGVDKTTADEEGRGLELPEAIQLLEDMRLSGRPVPDQIRDADLEYFASLTSKKQRKKFVTFMYRRENMRLKDKQKRLEKREQREKELGSDVFEDGPMPNRIFLKLLPKTILEFGNWKLAQGMKFGQNLVFDFSYDQYMRRPDAISLSMQMKHVIHENKQARESFHLHFVNHHEGALSHKEMVRTTQEDAYNKMMVTMSSDSLLDRFPKEEIIYLSPDSPNIMRTFDSAKTYVIGALVDGHRIEKGVSFGVAKRLGVAHVRLPIDHYLQWGSGGGKSLTLDQVVRILTEMKATNDWTRAMKHVPTRKHEGIKTPDQFVKSVTKKWQRQQEQPIQDEFIFSRAKQQNNGENNQRQNQDELDFQSAFLNNNKQRRFKEKSLGNKSGQKKQGRNFWEE